MNTAEEQRCHLTQTQSKTLKEETHVCARFTLRRTLLAFCGVLLVQIVIILLFGDVFLAYVLHPISGVIKAVTGKELTTGASSRFPWKPFKVPDVDCTKLFAGDKEELERAETVQRVPVPDTNISAQISEGCEEFLSANGFITESLTTEERDFPIAYSILVYKDAAQVLGLLRAIYRPQNFFCIHVDVKSSVEFHSAISNLAQCLDNVFLSSRSVDVRWGTFTVLEPDLICMEDLLKYKGWKYFINLTGQEFPLKTNKEIVSILTTLNGYNDIYTGNDKRTESRWVKHLPAPFNLTVRKGPVHVAVNRFFVHFVVNSPVARAFRDWCRKIQVPDEEFFPSLSINPQLRIPGSLNGNPDRLPNSTREGLIVRYKNWVGSKLPCAGRRVRGICILSVGDLSLLDQRYELFANKFHAVRDGILAMECLAEKQYNRTRDQTLGTLHFNVDYYRTLPFLKHIVPVPS